MNIVTGYRGEPHITAVQDRAANQGIFGEESYVLNVGQKLSAEVISANEIRINDGVLVHQGCVATINEGMYDSCDISNGSQGMLRVDLIVARYTKDAETGVEDIQLVVIEGTPAASSPAVPEYNTGDIQIGDSPVDMPLYRVNIDGVNIDSVTLIADVLSSLSDMITETASPVSYEIPVNGQQLVSTSRSGYKCIGCYLDLTSASSVLVIATSPVLYNSSWRTRLLNYAANANTVSGTIHWFWVKA